MIKVKYLPFVFFVVLLFSCKSVPEDLIMFNDLNRGRNLTGTAINMENSTTTILPGNTLRIIVSSGSVMDTKTYDMFNLLPVTPIDPATTRVSNDMEFQSYTVDENGEIDFPKLGKIKVQGLTHFELEALLQKKLKSYMSDPVVRVSIERNFIKIFGEVQTPGLFSIENRHNYTILEALAQAGGITSFGDKKQVKLIREENGRLESVVLDLTSSDIFTSPYYHLKQNDIIVVDPNAMRRKDAQYGASDNYKLAVISTIIGTLSSTLTIVFLLLDRTK
ncbi:MAG: polysaccharide export protein [Dysgonamonadaceae bacterium]|jgi:polysaccharide export outer membrane protein|nr:polysaccharide export protein [Dysgonamonadaceae bacterium]